MAVRSRTTKPATPPKKTCNCLTVWDRSGLRLRALGLFLFGGGNGFRLRELGLHCVSFFFWGGGGTGLEVVQHGRVYF